MNFYWISLGCAKNLVDSEIMMGHLMQKNCKLVAEPEIADIIIINTCSFVESAINESIDTILEMSAYKVDGLCKRLIVSGCLTQRYGIELLELLPEVDVFLGVTEIDKIFEAATAKLNVPKIFLDDPNSKDVYFTDHTRALTSSTMQYIKVSEGCDRKCTFCIIPKLRGCQKSRPVSDLLAEMKAANNLNIKEITLIGQETTAYGKDFEEKTTLSHLLNQVASCLEKIWIRILYGHPNSITEDLLQTVAAYPNICSYLDIPIQHASDKVLQLMGRNYNYTYLIDLFAQIRQIIPDISLRTTVIVGFPGETDADFTSLIKLIEAVKFDHLGGFIYSDSKDLPAHKLKNHVQDKLAKTRYDQLMEIQAGIALNNNLKKIGHHYEVLIEKRGEEGQFIGRTMFQAPEADGKTLIHTEKNIAGQIVQVKIVDATSYDLYGILQ